MTLLLKQLSISTLASWKHFLSIHVQKITTMAANTDPNVLFRIVMNQSSIAISLLFYRLFAIPPNHQLSPPSASSTYQVLSLDFEYP